MPSRDELIRRAENLEKNAKDAISAADNGENAKENYDKADEYKKLAEEYREQADEKDLPSLANDNEPEAETHPALEDEPEAENNPSIHKNKREHTFDYQTDSPVGQVMKNAAQGFFERVTGHSAEPSQSVSMDKNRVNNIVDRYAAPETGQDRTKEKAPEPGNWGEYDDR